MATNSRGCGQFGKVSTWQGEQEEQEEQDEFELEMHSEMERRAEKAVNDSGLGTMAAGGSAAAADVTAQPPSSYDELYFDSDEEEGEARNDRRRVKTNDDLFYDPEMDDNDQKWIDSVRGNYVPKDRRRLSEQNKTGKVKPLPNSDAVLNCPACFALLCLDCQRHEKYENQYRAMFVMNCTVNLAERLKFPVSKSGRKKKFPEGREPMSEEAKGGDEDSFNPVKCDHCSTEVGVFDKDEVYHFFNIVASHS